MDHYHVLEIARDATQKEIKEAHKRLVLKCHPDKNKGKEKEAQEAFQKIHEAYQVLSNHEKKLAYDEQLQDNRPSGKKRSFSCEQSFAYFQFGEKTYTVSINKMNGFAPVDRDVFSVFHHRKNIKRSKRSTTV